MKLGISLLLFVLIAGALTLTTHTKTANADPPFTGVVLGDTSGAGTSAGLFLLSVDGTMGLSAIYLCPDGSMHTLAPGYDCSMGPQPYWLATSLTVGSTVDLWLASTPPGGGSFDHFNYAGTGLGHFTDLGSDTCPVVGGSCEHYAATAGGESEPGTITLVFTSPPPPGVPSMSSVTLVDASVLGLGFAVACLGVIYALNKHRKQTLQSPNPVSPR